MSKKIPTLLGLFLVILLVVAVAVTTSSVQKLTRVFSQAESTVTPVQIEVANLSDISATISWITSVPSAGSVFYGRTPSLGDGVALDDRDQAAASSKYATHLVRLVGLKPNTKYYFKIGIGGTTFGNPEKGGSPFEFTTGPTLPLAFVIDPIYGKVNDLVGSAVSGAIVVWKAPGASPLASLTKSDGSYVLPIGNARSESLTSYLFPNDGLSETVSINTGDGSPPATIECKVGNDRPLPTVKVGEQINCLKLVDGSGNVGFKPPASPTVSSPSAGTVSINVNNGQSFDTALPTISGKAGPNQVIKIEIHSDTAYSGTVQADPSGNWSWTPPANLSPGQHTVTITVVNPDGSVKTETRSFTVLSGSPILPVTSGTPSATLTHLACLNQSCVAVQGAGPDTCSTDTDCQITLTPTPIPTITSIPTPIPTVFYPPPATGSTEIVLAMLTIGLIFVTLGLVIFLK